MQSDQLLLANVGDSSAVLVSLTNDGDVEARMLTHDHNGMDCGEARRIGSQFSHIARCVCGWEGREGGRLGSGRR